MDSILLWSFRNYPAKELPFVSKRKLHCNKQIFFRDQTVTRLWQVTERMNILYPENWTRAASEEIIAFQEQLTSALARQFARGPTQSRDSDVIMTSLEVGEPQARAGIRWTFARGLLYSVSLLTTIGKSKNFRGILVFLLKHDF